MRFTIGPLYAALALVLAAVGVERPSPSLADDPPQAGPGTGAAPVFPVKVSANRRYLVDQRGRPFLMIGDSPQTIVAKLSPADMEHYLANRHRYGINTLWVHVLCNGKLKCNDDGSTWDGIPPFLDPKDITTPNPKYFERLDALLKLAAKYNIMLLLDPIETIGWLDFFKSNGAKKAFEFGRYLGQRYRDFPNIVWIYGNDFQTWKDLKDDEVVLAVARGVIAVDDKHLNTVALNYLSSASWDNPRWRGIVTLNGVYTYFPAYAKIFIEYNRYDHQPIFLQESNYEFERNPNTDGGSLVNLRRQEYWTMLSGTTGQVYGSRYTWELPPGEWKDRLDTPGVRQLAHMAALFGARPWQDLVPDQTHAIVVGGYGTPTADGHGSVATDSYVTAASTPDRRLAIAYLPRLQTIQVDLSRFAGAVRARWFDPSGGVYRAITGSPFPNSGVVPFSPPSANRDGDGDWVLVLDVQ